MNFKTEQLKRESNKESLYYNLTIDSIGWNIPNYHTDKMLQDILFNLAKKVYILANKDYIVKLNSLPDKYEVADRIEEFEKMFNAIDRRAKK
jgi:hypothetical protein